MIATKQKIQNIHVEFWSLIFRTKCKDPTNGLKNKWIHSKIPEINLTLELLEFSPYLFVCFCFVWCRAKMWKKKCNSRILIIVKYTEAKISILFTLGDYNHHKLFFWLKCFYEDPNPNRQNKHTETISTKIRYYNKLQNFN